ncbi:bacterio-opsin activator [Halogeometricum borinquense]|uniref:Bacterio-opsin activator n=1 Tax=Halogeometricum borinquense TaxID=60847 RepID=A0A6C0UHQ0_9EURY|nr:helix-turn-helix domain-containing protein [Halogeometricum borinquense]QIB74955.1 bacterio-opsin activator [Halogeometricum borinquense]QIQ76046.1 bacterio-opsin activator [Halogeometricum borinquense]
MKRVAFGVSYPTELAHPIHRRLARTDGVSRMELLIWGPTANVTTLSWFDTDPETVRELLTAVGTLSAVSLVAGDDGTYAFAHQTGFEFDDDVLDLLASASVVFLPPVTFFEDGTATFEAVGETADLSDFYRQLGTLLDVRIERVHDFQRGSNPANLTTRQQSALETAVAVGYYDVPRTGTVEDIAAELDCATSTAGELLRKAESAVVTQFTDGSLVN